MNAPQPGWQPAQSVWKPGVIPLRPLSPSLTLPLLALASLTYPLFAPASIILERNTIRTAIARSPGLAKGRLRRTLGIMLLAFISVNIVAGVTTLLYVDARIRSEAFDSTLRAHPRIARRRQCLA